MQEKFVVNIIHRPELSPEYAERALGSANGVQDESLGIFLFQQKAAHDNGLKTTIQITYASLFSDEIVSVAREDTGMRLHCRFWAFPASSSGKSIKPKISVYGCLIMRQKCV